MWWARTPAGRELWCTPHPTTRVRQVAPGDPRGLASVGVGRGRMWVASAPAGTLAVVSNTGSGEASIVDVAQRKVVRTVKVGAMPKRLNVGLVEVP